MEVSTKLWGYGVMGLRGGCYLEEGVEVSLAVGLGDDPGLLEEVGLHGRPLQRRPPEQQLDELAWQ